VIATAEQAPGTHQAWRYQSGGRVVVMAQIVGAADLKGPRNFTR
jgi:hypothetical protein